ncbi:hypothetical protein [Microbacterium radiodurans]|uniref:Uncharacterized protein n=1 Tax=Microbacterium radiodurans TaxID=661398 RepID=A0A5J5IPW9_9MICO|nr:hypothetical protein [Microbacterium radiodurans]KAA9085482.1 hypothetical protein F6B42_13590 [Microbacterium radiodurans]
MSSSDRQRVERVGPRRARLTPAPDTTAEPVASDQTTDAPGGHDGAPGASGPNDERMRNDVPPHY